MSKIRDKGFNQFFHREDKQQRGSVIWRIGEGNKRYKSGLTGHNVSSYPMTRHCCHCCRGAIWFPSNDCPGYRFTIQLLSSPALWVCTVSRIQGESRLTTVESHLTPASSIFVITCAQGKSQCWKRLACLPNQARGTEEGGDHTLSGLGPRY